VMPLMGAVLAAQVTGAPLPLEQDLVDAIDPGRWQVRAARRQ
jgi:tRNA 5-methylaminomethyl-2-thiouridine biosynthesis bifunctional protein